MSDVQPEQSQPSSDAVALDEALAPSESLAGDVPAEGALDVEQTAERLNDIAIQSLDSGEVARQIEDLTSVVLDSAEVSTRSASIAADVSASMRAVVANIQESNQRSVLHSRIMLGAFIVSLVVAMAVFFGITLKMTKSIKELDVMVYAMSKRVLEVDASLTAISKTQADYSGLTEKQEELIVTQTRLASRVDEIGRSLEKMPMNMADQANKLIDPKFLLTGKQLQTLESRLLGLDAKLQAVEGKTSAIEQKIEGKLGGIDSKLQSLTSKPAAAAPTQQELHKLKQEMDAARQASERAVAKANEKADAALAVANKAAAFERSVQAERQYNQRSAAEQAAQERTRAAQPKPDRPATPKVDRAAQEKAAAERAEAARAAENERLQREQAAQEARRQQYPRFPAPPAEGN